MNHLRRQLFLATAFVCGFCGAAQANAPFFDGGPQLLINPGFETGSFAPWVSGGSGDNFVSTTNPHSGSFAASMGCVGSSCIVIGPSGVSGPGSVIQTLNLQPGIYMYSFWVTNPGGTNQLAASVGSNVLINTSLGAIPYTQFSFVTAVPGGSTNVAFAIRQDPAFMQEDDNALIQVDDGQGNNLGAASQTVATQASREFMDSLFEHLTRSHADMTSFNGFGDYRLFGNVYGDSASWNNSGARAHRLGFMVGGEWSPNNDWNLGFAVGSAKTRYATDTLFTNNWATANETLGALYANWSPDCWPGYTSGVFGYGYSSNHLMRENFLGATGAYVPTRQWFGGAEVGFDWSAIPPIILTPFARIDGAGLSQSSYWEYAYGNGQLVPAWVDKENVTVGRTLVGLKGRTDFQAFGSLPWQFSGKVAWQYEFNRRRSVQFFEMTGSVGFSGIASGAVPVANSFVAGAGLEAPITPSWRLSLNYDGNYGSGQTIHQGTFGVKASW